MSSAFWTTIGAPTEWARVKRLEPKWRRRGASGQAHSGMPRSAPGLPMSWTVAVARLMFCTPSQTDDAWDSRLKVHQERKQGIL